MPIETQNNQESERLALVAKIKDKYSKYQSYMRVIEAYSKYKIGNYEDNLANMREAANIQEELEMLKAEYQSKYPDSVPEPRQETEPEPGDDTDGTRRPRQNTEPTGVPPQPRQNTEPTGVPPQPRQNTEPTGVPPQPRQNTEPTGVPPQPRQNTEPTGVPPQPRQNTEPTGVPPQPRQETQPGSVTEPTPTPGPTPTPVPTPDLRPGRPNKVEGTSQDGISEAEKNRALKIIVDAINKFGEKTRACAQYIKDHLPEILIILYLATGLLLASNPNKPEPITQISTSHYDIHKPSKPGEVPSVLSGSNPGANIPDLTGADSGEQPPADEFNGNKEVTNKRTPEEVNKALQNSIGGALDKFLGADVGAVFLPNGDLAFITKSGDQQALIKLYKEGGIFAVGSSGQVIEFNLVGDKLVINQDSLNGNSSVTVVANTGNGFGKVSRVALTTK